MTTQPALRSTTRHWRGALAVAVIGTLALAGCSSSNDTAATTTTAPDTCAAVQVLSDSIATLVSSDTLSGGQAAIQSALDEVTSSADELANVAGDQLSSDVDALTQALDGLSSALGDLGSDATLGDTLTALGTSVNDVVSAFGTLTSDASAELSNCDITTPTTVGG